MKNRIWVLSISYLLSMSAYAAQFDCYSTEGLLYRANTSYGDLEVFDAGNQSLWYNDGYNVTTSHRETFPTTTVYEFKHHEDEALDMIIRVRGNNSTAEFLAKTDRDLKDQRLICAKR